MQFSGYLIRYNELALKGNNRSVFEKQLVSNIKQKLDMSIERLWGRIILRCERSPQVESVLTKVFGLSSISPAWAVSSNLEEIKNGAFQLMLNTLEKRKGKGQEPVVTFRMSTNRVDKRFFPTSPQMNRTIADFILKQFPVLKVNLTSPEIDLGIEIRDSQTFLFSERLEGFGGLPVGSAPRVLTLLSGGIDSPVSAWCIMKRGAPTDFIHFFSYPYTSLQSKEKVTDLVKVLSQYQNHSTLWIVPFTEIQEEIQKRCRESLKTLLYRRLMMKIATCVVKESKLFALVTGENLGQVASQTLENISNTNDATDRLVLRPLIAFDKQETIGLAKRIGTYDISIRPYDDCCTLFGVKNPATHALLDHLLSEEQKIPIDSLIKKATSKMERMEF